VFDYVIVGGGSAGCVVAARLAEDPGSRVLLLEAGPDASGIEEVRVPAAYSRLFRSQYDWNYVTLPQERADTRPVYWPSGKVLGGSSAINAMIYVRGNRDDYDGWRSNYGCTGWGYNDLFPYFHRAEDNSRAESPYHGKGGPLPVQDLRHKSEHARGFIEAAIRRGALANDDFNGAQQEGVGFYQVTQRDGVRCSAADAYLANRPQNLTIVTNALVTGLVLEGGRAAGVTYLCNGRDETARAEAEVILAAGAIGTPQLLMLSGIGPADHLREHGIYVVADMPSVGANLIDPPSVPVLWSTPGVKSLWESTRNRDFARWRITRKGPLTSNVAEAGGFVRSDPRLSAPDLQWHVLPVAFRDQGLADPARRAMTVLVTLVDVASRGRLKLASRDPRHRPLIDPDYLSDVRDLNALAVGVRMARDYGTAAPLAKICAEELAPGDGIHTDHELREFIRSSVVTAYRPAGTCAMGGDVAMSASGYDSVVDPLLRVRGVDGLRIVDASVMPTLPRGGAMAPVIAIAERAADLIAGRAPLVPVDPQLAAAAGPAAAGPAVQPRNSTQAQVAALPPDGCGLGACRYA
jgi:choline dehydrogenase